MSTYQFVQLHSKQDPTKLDFPIVPLESIVISVNALSTRAKICLLDANNKVPQDNLPVAAVPGTYVTSAAVAPANPQLNDKYYNTDDHKVYTAVQSGGAVVWDNGAPPDDYRIYVLPGNTLYIKSVNENGTVLAPIGQPIEPEQLTWLSAATGCRQSKTTYAIGNMVMYPGQPKWYMQAMTAGVTAASLPVFPGSPVSGTTELVDGTVTWKLFTIAEGTEQATTEANGTVRIWTNMQTVLPDDDAMYVPTVEAVKAYVQQALQNAGMNITPISSVIIQ